MWVGLYLDCFQYTQSTSANLKIEFDGPVQGLQLWLVAEVRYLDCSQYKYSSPIIGLWLYLDRIGYTVQERNRELGQIQTHLGSSWFRKRWCENDFRNRKDCQQGKSSVEKHTCSLSDSKQLNPIAEMVVSCIDAAYQVDSLFILDANHMTDEVGSISRPKKNLMNQWKALQRVSELWPANSTDSRKSPTQMNCARQ